MRRDGKGGEGNFPPKVKVSRKNTRAAVDMGIPMGMGMGMIFHPHRPMGILWGFLINLK